MAKAITINKRKIVKFTKRIEGRIRKTFFSMAPEDVAYYFIYVAGSNEITLINKTLERAPSKYLEKVRYYINHPIELGEKISKLEKRTR